MGWSVLSTPAFTVKLTKTATTELASIAVALLSMWLVIEYGMDVPVLRHSATRLVGLPKRIWESKFVTKVSERIKLKGLRKQKGSIPVFVRKPPAIWLKKSRRR